MDPLDTLQTLRRDGIAHVLVTVAAVRGSVPADPGHKLIATSSGLHSGSVGGGKIEARAISHSLGILADPSSPSTSLLTWNLQRDVAMTCGGGMTLLYEVFRPSPLWHIVIFGAGHIVQALLPVLSTLPCRIDVIDTRPDWLEKIPCLPNVILHPVSSHQDAIGLVTGTSQVLSITRGHSSDLPVLAAVLRKFPEISFLGVIGSASKRAVLTRELHGLDLAPGSIARIHCPLGLPLGGNSPSEIAISITAQLLQEK